jgi:hypothetical protein
MSITRSERFHVTKSYCNTDIYNIPSALSKTTTSLGIGPRFEMKMSAAPPLTNYNIKSEFGNMKRYSFGVSRDRVYPALRDRGENIGPPRDFSPGPAAYKDKTKMIEKTESPKFSLSKNLDYNPVGEMKFSPGPGAYSDKFTMNKYGKYFVSKV